METKRRRKYATPEESFAARTEWQGECLVWIGSRRPTGYGQIAVNKRPMGAHRYAWERVHGPLPPGIVIDHKCHNPACANVRHLRAVTQAQNMENLQGATSKSTSGYLGVFLDKGTGKWMVRAGSGSTRKYGGLFPPYELHVAAYKARLLRNEHFTHNDKDRT